MGSSGDKTLVKEQPAAVYAAGVAQVTANLTEAGMYSVKLAFGAAKTADEVIEVPVTVAMGEQK